EDTTAPYTFSWTGVGVGDHTLTAKATDDQTASTTSALITVHVSPNQPPAVAPVSPPEGALGIAAGGTAALEASVSDPENQPLTVTFYGRAKMAQPGPDFTLVTLPDTQFYSENNNNRFSQFLSQTNWIVSQKNALNIAFVAHMGDMVQNGDSLEAQWIRADSAMDIIEDPATTFLTHGIPWGGAPGNHDIGTGGGSGTTNFWNQYFGTSRWSGRPYFQGNYGVNNNNNYQFFSASGLDFIIINLAYRTSADPAVHDWADALLKAHPNRRGIITSHWIIGTGVPASFGGQGQALYDNLKDNPNLFLMLCGHIHGEGMRTDTFEGRTVYTVLQDYQDRSGAPGGLGGGDAWLRYFTFSPANNAIHAKTYRTTSGAFETDADSQFTLPYNMSGGSNSWVPLGTVDIAAGATTASLDWTGLDDLTEYEWYAAVSDGPNSIGSGVRSFTTAGNTPPTVTLTAPAESAAFAMPVTINLAATAADAGGSIAQVEFYAGATKVGEDATAPYEFAWTPISGAYALTAVAEDNQGERTPSATVNITVTNPANIPPAVAITAPAPDSTLVASSLNITATADDTDGTIAKVEFLNGSTLIGEDTAAPFAFNWTGITPGVYALTARATDNDGGIATSAAVNVTITVPGNFTGSLTENFDTLGAAGTTPPGTWTVKNGNSGTTKTTWLTSIPANGANSVASMVDAATPLAAVTTPTAANNNGYNAALSPASTADRVLATSPTSVSGMALQLQLNNGAGVPLTALKISYDIVRYAAAATTNELPGYWLFYSLDNGLTWTNVAALNPTISAGPGVVVPNTSGVTNAPPTDLALNSPWGVNTPLLLRWVDDNADPTSPDHIIGLDNVS
ncbi:MAG TPA: Ig-like domain-containing protein, partial [Prosthecobacter sp.]|nr:Ig-like domain-containing protein [Prosthecobacter sp.]